MMHTFSLFRTRPYILGTTLLAVPLLTTLAGCGSGSGTQPLALASSGASATAYAGRYVSTVMLRSGRVGTVDFTVTPDGRATGTLTVSEASSETRQVFSFSAGVYGISGTIDPTTGEFTLNGSLNGQAFALNGTLPTLTNGRHGAYTLTAGGETFQGSFTPPTTLPTPGPGTSPSPNPSPSATTPPASGNVQFTVISKSADCNVDESKLSGLAVGTATLTGSGGSIYAFVGNTSSPTGGNFTLNWTRLNASGLVPERFTFTPTVAIGAFGDEFQGLFSSIGMPLGGLSAGAWYPSGGNLIVESVSGSTVTVRGENVVFAPNRFNAIAARGTFTANFRVTFQNVQGL